RSIRNLDDGVLGSLTDDEFMRLARIIKVAIEMESDPKSTTTLRENIWAVRAARLPRQPAARGLAKVRRRLRFRSEKSLANTLRATPDYLRQLALSEAGTIVR